MYTQIWNKYLPIIRILLKRSATEEQSLKLNTSDFEKAGSTRKSGYKFNIHFSNGRVDNVISTSPLAKDLAATLLQDPMVKELFKKNEYQVSMNTKFQLFIKMTAKAAATEQPQQEEKAAEEVSS